PVEPDQRVHGLADGHALHALAEGRDHPGKLVGGDRGKPVDGPLELGRARRPRARPAGAAEPHACWRRWRDRDVVPARRSPSTCGKILAGKILSQKYHLRMTSATPDHIGQILAQWRRERPDLDVAPMGLLGRLFRVVQLADATLTKSLADRYGLQPGWFDLLAALRRAGAPYELNPTQLTRATMLSSGGMTKRLDRMAEAGLVQRRGAAARPPRTQ